MPKHLVFLVHGMGQNYNKTDQPGSIGWSDCGVDALVKSADTLKYVGNVKEDYEFIPISYSKIFDDYIVHYRTEAEKFYNIPGSGITDDVIAKFPFIGALIKLAKSKPDTNKFLISHVSDVAFFALTHLQDQTRETVRNGILKGLAQQQGAASWSIIAHSLGTRVVHDTLREIFSNKDNYSVYGKPTMVMMVGNVIELMEIGNVNTLYNSTNVFPSNVGDEGCCYQFVNGCHPLDPFTWLRRFNPVNRWPSWDTVKDRYVDVKVNSGDITQCNTHDFCHYLSHPLVQKEFYLATHNRSRAYPIDDAAVTSAMQVYEKLTLEGKWQQLKQEIESLKVTNLNDWEKLASALSKFYDLLSHYCDNLV